MSKLEEIQFSLEGKAPYSDVLKAKDIAWLIARVKRLEKSVQEILSLRGKDGLVRSEDRYDVAESVLREDE